MSCHLLLLRHYQPQCPPLRQHHIPVPLLSLLTLRFFPPLYLKLQHFYKRHNQPPSSPLYQQCSNSPPRATYPTIFSRLSTSMLTNLTEAFKQALPTSNVTPTPTQPPDYPPCDTHPRFFPVSLPQCTPFL